jgi:hypothetical protein
MAEQQATNGDTKNSGPYLAFAVICERVLRETDQVPSLIRIFDHLLINGPSPQLSPNSVPLTIAVGFRAGRKQGKSTVSIRPLSPSGQDLPGIEQPILFQGDQESGANLVGQILFPIQEEGLYWFGIFLDGTELTRVPLRIVYQQVLIAEGAICSPWQKFLYQRKRSTTMSFENYSTKQTIGAKFNQAI